MLVDVLDHILERLSARRMSTQDFCATLVTIDADNWQPFGIAPTAGSAAQPVSFDVLTMVLARVRIYCWNSASSVPTANVKG